MDATRFDRLTTSSPPVARRQALATARPVSPPALLATGLGTAHAQDATPGATPAVDPNNPHPSADTAGAHPEFLFVQPFDSGAWSPTSGADATYTLTLTGAAAQTVYFSDRPERIVGLAPTQRFLDGLGFTPNNPPNAALVATPDGSEARTSWSSSCSARATTRRPARSSTRRKCWRIMASLGWAIWRGNRPTTSCQRRSGRAACSSMTARISN